MPDQPNGTQTITIQGHEVTIKAPYVAGHALTENEASAMNQLRAENVRNNVAGAIRKAAEATGGKPESLNLDETYIGEGDARQTLAQHIAAYDTDYEFGARRTRSAAEPVDPVAREAQRIAKEHITNALRDRVVDGKPAPLKVKDLAEGVFDSLVAKHAASEHVQKEAKRRVSATSKIGLEDLGIGDITAAESAKEPEPA